MQVYVRAKSKKEINERLAAGQDVAATEYNMFTGDKCLPLRDCPDHTVVKVFDKYVQGSPYAKAYGTWDMKKNRVK